MSPGFLLWKVSNLHQRLQKKALESLDLTPSQFSILACYFFLCRKSGSVSQTELCQFAGIDKMLVSDLTQALLKKKLITRLRNKDDRRSFQISITPEGATLCNQALKVIEELDVKFFNRSGRQKEFIEIMNDLVES